MDVDQLLRGIGYNFRQQGAGVAETFLASPEATGVEKLVPNFVWGLAGLAGSDHAAQLYQAGVQQANQMTGVEEPKNVAENLNRIALASLLPGPKTPQAATRAGKVLNTIGEILMPLNQTRTTAGGVMSVAVPLAISEGVHEYGQQKYGDDGYTSAVDLLAGRNTQAPQSNPAVPSVDDLLGAPEVSATKQQVYERTPTIDDLLGAVQTQTSASRNALLVQPQAQSVDDILAQAEAQVEAEKDNTRWGSLAAVGALTAGLLGGVAAYRSAMKAKLAQTTALHGIKPVEGLFDAATMVKADLLDQNTPLYKAADDALNPGLTVLDKVKRYGQRWLHGPSANDVTLDDLRNDIITSTSPHTTAAKMEAAMNTGRLPGSSVKAPKLTVILESIAQLPDDMGKAYDDILTAKDKLQQLWRENGTSWGSVSEPELQNIVAMQRAYPVVDKLVESTHDFYQAMRQYMHDTGFITRDKLVDWNRAYRYYVPSGANFERDPMLGLIREFDPQVAASFEHMMTRNTLEHGVQPGEGIRPSQLHSLYMNHLIRAAENNRIRREFFDLVDSNPAQKFAQKVSEAGPDTVTIYRNGIKEHRKVDPVLGEALKFKPLNVNRMWNASRRIMQELTTGKVRPDYAPTAVALELGTSAFSRHGDMGMGLISEALNRTGVPKNMVDVFNKYAIIDPTMALSPITGTARGLWADLLHTASRNAEVSLNTNGWLARTLGPKATKQIADTMGEAWMNTTKAKLMTHGGGSAPIIEHQTKYQTDIDLSNIAPTFYKANEQGLISQAKANAFTRLYTSLYENFHNSVRLQYAASNFRKGMSDAELTKVAGRTRELTGDIAQHGGRYKQLGRANNWMYEKVPYYNIALQSMRAVSRGFAENPVRNTLLLSGLGWTGLEAMTSQSDNPAVRQKYWDEWTPEQRAAVIPFFADDGSLLTELPVPHELRGFWSALIESYGTVSGMKAGLFMPPDQQDRVLKSLAGAFDYDWTDADKQDLTSGMKAAAGALIPRPMPPAVGAGLALGGVNPNQIFPWEGRASSGFNKIREEKITADESGKSPDRLEIDLGRLGEWQVKAKVETAINELIGAASAPLLNAIDTSLRLSKEKRDFNSIAEGALKQLTEAPRDRLAIIGGEQMWDWEKKVLTQDSVGKLLTDKMQKLDELEKFIQQERRDGANSTTPRPGVEEVGYYLPPSIAGTRLGEVASAVKPLHDWVNSKYKPQVQALYKQLQAMPANTAFAADPVARREQANEIVKQIRAKNAELLELITDQEDQIGHALGIKHFRIDDMDVGELKKQGVGK